MNTDAFEGSETIGAISLPDTYNRSQTFDPCDDGLCFLVTCTRCNPNSETSPDGGDYLLPADNDNAAEMQDMRLKRCGLVWYEDQLNGHRFVAPAGRVSTSRLKVQPLYLVKPSPGLEIEAIDGEKYLLPKDFKGDWFSVRSPRGVSLIGE